METAVAVAFNDYTIIATDKVQSFSILRLTEDASKIHKLTSHIVMAMTGEPGDCDQFSRFVQCNFELEKFRDDGWEVDLKRAFHWITWELAQDLRSRSPYHVFPIIAGYDNIEKKARVYWVDYLGTGSEVSYGGHGYGESLATAFFDRHYKPDMPKDVGIELVKEGLDAIQTRIIIGQTKFQMVLVDKDGVHALPDHVVDRIKCLPK